MKTHELVLLVGVLGIFLFWGCSGQNLSTPGEVAEFWGIIEEGLGEILTGDVQVLLLADISKWGLQNLGEAGPDTWGMWNINGIYYFSDRVAYTKWGLYAQVGGEWRFFNCVIMRGETWALDKRTVLEEGYVLLGGIKWRPLLKVSFKGEFYLVPEQDIRYQKKVGKEGTITYDYFLQAIKGPAISGEGAFSRINLEIPVLTICGLCDGWPISLLQEGDGVEAYRWLQQFFVNLELFNTGLTKTFPVAP